VVTADLNLRLQQRSGIKGKPIVVTAAAISKPIQPSPGFAKKGLSESKLDLMALCQYGCLYCSSNHGNYLRINQEKFADLAQQQLGERLYPAGAPNLTIQWPDVVRNLEKQLANSPPEWGANETLVFSMLTDGFSPMVVQSGTTEKALRLVLEKTSFRIRVLTKNAVVGQPSWIRFFQEHRDRFVVGLSIGTLDDAWAKNVEMFTAVPSNRLRALRALQDAGVPTYGMLCPIFPDVLHGSQLEYLVDQIRPELVEHIWAEPYNDRANWRKVRNGYQKGSFGYEWFNETYEMRNAANWSRYATDVYVRLREKALSEGWIDKLRYLLYEGGITADDAKRFRGLDGVWLQSKPATNGTSRNPHFANYQRETKV
jgi:DNA repair photolyase